MLHEPRLAFEAPRRQGGRQGTSKDPHLRQVHEKDGQREKIITRQHCLVSEFFYMTSERWAGIEENEQHHSSRPAQRAGQLSQCHIIGYPENPPVMITVRHQAEPTPKQHTYVFSPKIAPQETPTYESRVSCTHGFFSEEALEIRCSPGQSQAASAPLWMGMPVFDRPQAPALRSYSRNQSNRSTRGAKLAIPPALPSER